MVDKFAGSKLEQLIQVGSVGPERAKHMEVRSQRAPDGCAEDRTDSFRMWRDGRVVEGAPLLRVYGSKAHRGFESLSLRQSGMKKARSSRAFFIPASNEGIEPSRFEGSTSSPGANLIAASQDEAATRRAKRMDARSHPSLSASHKQKGPLLRALLFMTPTRDQSPRDSRVRQICRTQIWTSLRNPKRWPNGWSTGMCEIILSPPVVTKKAHLGGPFC